MIRDHWYRAATNDQPCLFLGCARPQAEHRESVGEWMDPRHWFLPHLGRGCLRCKRTIGHSTHRMSRKYWGLWGWGLAKK